MAATRAPVDRRRRQPAAFDIAVAISASLNEAHKAAQACAIPKPPVKLSANQRQCSLGLRSSSKQSSASSNVPKTRLLPASAARPR